MRAERQTRRPSVRASLGNLPGNGESGTAESEAECGVHDYDGGFATAGAQVMPDQAIDNR